MSRARLLREIDSRELCDWIAFHRLKNENAEKKTQKEKQVNLKDKFLSVMGGKIKAKNK